MNKKIILRTLSVVNMIFILFLLTLSSMIFFVKSSSEVFSLRAFIIEGGSIESDILEQSLVIAKKNSKELKKDDYILVRNDSVQNNAITVKKVLSTDNQTITYLFDETQQMIVEKNSPLYLGKITFINHSMGKFFSMITQADNQKIVYIAIGSGFCFSMLIISFLYYFFSKKTIDIEEETSNFESVKNLVENLSYDDTEGEFSVNVDDDVVFVKHKKEQPNTASNILLSSYTKNVNEEHVELSSPHQMDVLPTINKEKINKLKEENETISFKDTLGTEKKVKTSSLSIDDLMKELDEKLSEE